MIPGAEEVLALLELRRPGRGRSAGTSSSSTAPRPPRRCGCWRCPRRWAGTWTASCRWSAASSRPCKPVLSRAAGVPDARGLGLRRRRSGCTPTSHEVQELLTGKEASVRLVLTPEAVVVAEARRSLTSLSLFGYRVDGVVANRIFPDDAGDPWRDQWVAAQRGVLAEVEQSFPELPIWRSGYRPSEPVGVDELHRLVQEAYGEDDPLALPVGEGPLTITRRDDGALLRIDLPFAQRGDVDLARHGDELVISVGLLPAPARAAGLPGAAEGRRRARGAGSAQGALPRRTDRRRRHEQPTDDTGRPGRGPATPAGARGGVGRRGGGQARGRALGLGARPGRHGRRSGWPARSPVWPTWPATSRVTWRGRTAPTARCAGSSAWSAPRPPR